MRSNLRRKLEARAGSSECEVLIPYFLLPPRFYKLSGGRNMILVLDMDVVVHARWEGPHPEAHIPLSPRAAARLIKEVGHSLSRYRKDLQVLSRFIEQQAEAPFWDPRKDSLTLPREENLAWDPREEEAELIAIIHGGEVVQGTVEELSALTAGPEGFDFGW